MLGLAMSAFLVPSPCQKKHNIREMAEILTQVFEYNGKLTFDTTKSDGLPRKLIDITRLESMDWKYNIDLESGLTKTFIWYLNEQLKG